MWVTRLSAYILPSSKSWAELHSAQGWAEPHRPRAGHHRLWFLDWEQRLSLILICVRSVLSLSPTYFVPSTSLFPSPLPTPGSPSLYTEACQAGTQPAVDIREFAGGHTPLRLVFLHLERASLGT